LQTIETQDDPFVITSRQRLDKASEVCKSTIKSLASWSLTAAASNCLCDERGFQLAKTKSTNLEATKSVSKLRAMKSVSKPGAPPVRPVKETLTKSALIRLLAEQNDIPLKTAAGVYATLESVFLGSVHPRGVGEFTLPGLLKVSLRKVPARKAGTLVRNPGTGEMVKAIAKPASFRVAIRALSKLKTAASP
jgi:hypothetical protein